MIHEKTADSKLHTKERPGSPGNVGTHTALAGYTKEGTFVATRGRPLEKPHASAGPNRLDCAVARW